MGCSLDTGSYFLGFLCGNYRPKSENWATLTPRSSATVRPREKLTDLRNSLALGLQRGVYTVSLCSASRDLQRALSEVPV